MVKKRTLFRINNDVELSEAKAIAIAESLGVDVEEDNLHISHVACTEVNYETLFQTRFNLILAGASFLLKCWPDISLLPREKVALEQFIGSLKSSFEEVLHRLKGGSPVAEPTEAYQQALHEHCCLLIAGFSKQLAIDITKAKAWLAKAEEYHLLVTPREDIITVTALPTTAGNYFVLQREAQLPPLSEELIEDYWRIKENAASLPEWFKALEPLEQTFLRHVLDTVETKAALPHTVVNLSSKLRTVPGAANFRNHFCYLYDEHWHLQAEFKRSASSIISSRDMRGKSREVRDYHAIQNLRHVIDQSISEKIIQLLNEKEGALAADTVLSVKIPALVQTLVSPIIPSFFQPDFELVRDKSVAMHKLVYQQRVERTVLNALNEEITVIIDITVDLSSTNHPLNLANRWDFTLSSDEECRAYISKIESYLSENPRHAEAANISALLTEYKKILAKGSLLQANLYDLNKRELYLSSLEQLIMVRMGGVAYGSCVSAKDRKAIEFMHTDAMELFHSLYGRWPSYDDDLSDPRTALNRAKFVDIFTELYLSRHHHRSAALNAWGSEGIKTPEMYLPSDVAEAIAVKYQRLGGKQTDLLKVDDRLASFNELRSIVSLPSLRTLKTWQYYKERANNQLTALLDKGSESTPESTMAGSEEQLEKDRYICACLHLVKGIVAGDDETCRRYWHSKTAYSRDIRQGFGLFSFNQPTGVKAISSLFQKKETLSASDLKEVFQCISGRLSGSAMRYPDTGLFYNIIQSLFFGQSRLPVLKTVHEELKEFYSKATQQEAPEVITYSVDRDTAAEAALTEEEPLSLGATSY